MTDPATTQSRIVAIDAVRGFAVLGILVMNIVAFGLPFGAYDDPRVAGGADGADAVAWVIASACADGKMRGLFTMLFGVSLLVVADSAAANGNNPAAIHYRRMGVLLGIGMLHGYLLWYGDILAEYALAGAILFAGWRWRTAALFYTAAVLFAATVAMAVANCVDLAVLRDAAAAPGAPAATRTAWRAFTIPDLTAPAKEILGYRGNFTQVMATRLADLGELQQGLPIYLIEAVGTAAFGMALYRSGYFTRWYPQTHRMIAIIGLGAGLPVSAAIAAMVARTQFDPVTASFGALLSLIVRPAIVLGYASVVILLVDSGRSGWLSAQLAAAGQMALSNYLATSIAMTTIFYGTGFGWFGVLSRAQLYPLVLGMWAAILIWSQPWLRRFRYGPVEWLWRSASRGKWQQMLR